MRTQGMTLLSHLIFPFKLMSFPLGVPFTVTNQTIVCTKWHERNGFCFGSIVGFLV